MSKKFFIILYILFFWVSFAHASVEIREIMYNPEGSDTNREWIEIYNNGDSIDIGSWYFFENDTYHGLYPDGFSQLLNGERALIVKDIPSAISELGSDHKFIKSSFSLSNTGEELAIFDENRLVVDSYTYNSDTGGNGDGDSLQFIDSRWVHAYPTPGEQNSSNIYHSDDEIDPVSIDSSNDDTHEEEEQVEFKPYYLPNIEIPTVIVAQVDFKFLAEVTYVKEKKREEELDGYYFINFGDGNSFESDKRIEMNYRYHSPGNYILVFEYYSSRFAFEHGKEPDALLRKNIKVIGHDIEITEVDSLKGITLKNKTSSTINLSSWKILWKNHTYTFPRYSYINEGNTISLSPEVLGFSPIASSLDKVQLLSNAQEIISFFPSVGKRVTTSHYKLNDDNLHQDTSRVQKTKASNTSVHISDENKEESHFFDASDSYLDQYLSENPDKVEVDFGENNMLTASVDNAHTNTNSSIYYALGSLLLILSIARFSKYRSKDDKSIYEDTSDLGTIEILE